MVEIAEGEIILRSGKLDVTLLADVEQLAAVEVRAAPGWGKAPLHMHARHAEAVFVLEGTLCLQLGDEEIEAAPGTYAFVPRGTPHTLRNKSLGVHSPGVEHMLIALAQATTPQEIGEISARFDSEPA